MINTYSQEPLDQIPATHGTLSSPDGLNSRVDSSLNDPNAIAHPELTKADKAMAEELQIYQAPLDKSALRKLSIKQAEEAKIVAEMLAARERQAMQNGSAHLGDVGDVDDAVNDRTEDAGRAEEHPRAAKARVPNDVPNGPPGHGDARNDEGHDSPDRSIAAERAAVFRRETDAVVGTQQYPELSGAYAVVAAIDHKAKVDGLSPQARHIVAERVRDNIAARLRHEELPRMNVLSESPTVSREAWEPQERSAQR